MKKILVDGIYWIAVVIILTAVIFSSGYTLGESFLMSLIFIPGCMILKFILPKGPHGAVPQLCWAVAHLFLNFEGISRD